MFSLSATISEIKKLEPAFFARSPGKIKHAKQIPVIDKKYEETPTQEYAKSLGIEWTDAIVLDSSLRNKLWEDSTHPKKALSLIEDRCQNPLDNLVICDINPEIGKGVFVAADAKPIPAGTIIGIYAGELTNKFFRQGENEYTMSLGCKEHAVSSLQMQGIYSDAKKTRNITAFIQDAPDEMHLQSITVNSNKSLAKEMIATANLLVFPAIYKGCPISFLATVREISPGEQLLFPYEDDGFWTNKNRCVFDKNGHVIGKFSSATAIQLDNKSITTKDMLAPRWETNIVKSICKKLLKLNENTFDSRQRFISDVLSTLEVHANRHSKETAEWKYIETLRQGFIKSNQVSTQFNNLHHGLSDKSNQDLLKSLGTLRGELIFHMKHYQATKPKTLLKTSELPADSNLKPKPACKV